jgi:hypothetical protein
MSGDGYDLTTRSAPPIPDDTKYLKSEDWPVGEDDVFASFDEPEVARAVYEAERRLEADINAGTPITDPGALHSLAASYWATYRLVSTVKHPASKYSGELADPDGRASYASALKEDYYDLVDRIEAFDEDEVQEVGGTRTAGGFVRTVTPGSKSDR